MKKINGKIISGGICMGKLKAFHRTENLGGFMPKYIDIQKELDIQSELDIFEKASYYVRDYYDKLYKKADEAGDIFEGLSLLATDEELVENVQLAIKKNMCTAEYAVYSVSRNFMETLDMLEDEYISQRAMDIDEVADKIIEKILDFKERSIWDENIEDIALNDDLPYILITDKLLPEMLINDDSCNIKGVVTSICPDNSHAAIIARMRNIPVIADVNIDELKEEDFVIIDDRENILIINPDEDTRSHYDKLLKDNEEIKKELEKYKYTETIANNGKCLKVCANVSCLDDIKAALENGADGIGLFRTELMFMDRETAPAEEEQFLIYREAAMLMKDKSLVIRTFDGGMDKPLKFMETSLLEMSLPEASLLKSSMPKSDLRGIELLFRNINILKTQLRAIYRAAVYGNISVMFPMISHIEELEKIYAILKEVKSALANENIKYNDIKIGIMIETPSAVELSDILTKDIDFVSIGTNDLIQYTFFKDRTCEDSTNLCDDEYDKLFSMIKKTADNSHKNNCKVSVCGELAGNMDFTLKFIEAGIDELSVIPSKILLLRKQIIS